MAYCGKCGLQLNEDVKFCPGCGEPVAAPVDTPPPAQETKQNGVKSKAASFNNTTDTTADFDANDITQNKTMGILAYFGPLVLIPIFAAKESRFARFHANQGLILLIACVAYGIVLSILNTLVLLISWRLIFVTTILGLLYIVFGVLAIIGIINAAKGKAKELPLIGKFKILK